MKRYNRSIVLQFDSDSTGNGGAELPVTVRDSTTQIIAKVYSANDPILANEITDLKSDSLGNYTFYVQDGIYDIIINEGLTSQLTLKDEQIIDQALLALEKVGLTVVPGQTVYSLENDMTSQNVVYINGVMQHETDGAYSIVNGDLVLSEGLTSKDTLEVWNRIVGSEVPTSPTDIDYSYVSIRDLLNTDLSSVPFAIGERIETKGKANEGDGGGSIYEVATFTTVDFTSVIPLNGSVVGKLIRGPVRSRGNNATEVIAHRGFTDFNVEQTMYAFTSALEYGADSLECDIQVTSDGELILFHDVEMEVLLNNITGKVKENTFAATQLATWREFSFGNVLEDKVHLTKFTDLLNYVQQVGCFLHAEIKDYRTRADIDLIVAAIVELGLEGNVTLHSFFLSDIQYVRSINKNIKVAFLSNTLDGVDFDNIAVTVGFDWVKRDKFAMAALRIEAIDDPLNIPNPIIKEFHDADVEVAAWTLNNAKDIAIARRNNVNAIMCDLPSFRKQPLVRNHGTSI